MDEQPVKKYAVDLNCDLGEGAGNDREIMPYITSVNIACGFHAGDVSTIAETIALAAKYNVHVGAHPSFPDRENFGRKEMDFTFSEIYDLVSAQVDFMLNVARITGVRMHHVKPHGALYNLSVKKPEVARAIAEAVFHLDDTVILFGLSGSHSVVEAKKIGLKIANEAFADRTYQDDGTLTPRSKPDAMISDHELSLLQVMQIVLNGTVRSVHGKTVPVKAETVCLHGDEPEAAFFARYIYERLKAGSIEIVPVE